MAKFLTFVDGNFVLKDIPVQSSYSSIPINFSFSSTLNKSTTYLSTPWNFPVSTIEKSLECIICVEFNILDSGEYIFGGYLKNNLYIPDINFANQRHYKSVLTPNIPSFLSLPFFYRSNKLDSFNITSQFWFSTIFKNGIGGSSLSTVTEFKPTARLLYRVTDIF